LCTIASTPVQLNLRKASGYAGEISGSYMMASDDEVIPLQQGIETAADDADLEEVYNTERHLL
jgi:hypothetical protein